MAGALLAMSSWAAEQAPAPAAKAQSPLMQNAAFQTLVEAGREVMTGIGRETNPGKQMEWYSHFEFSPALRPRLKAIFGSEKPFPVARVAGSAKGQVDYVGKLAAHSYREEGGPDIRWADLTYKTSFSKSGLAYSGEANWPSLSASWPRGGFALQDVSVTSKQRVYANEQVAYGPVAYRVGSAVFSDTAPGGAGIRELLRLEGLETRAELARRGAMADMDQRTTIKTIMVAGERIDRFNLSLRITNMPAKALAEMTKAAREQQVGMLPTALTHDRTVENLKNFAQRAVMAGATVFLDEFSAIYHGHVASITGQLSFRKVVEADFNNMPELLKKLVARFEVRVPVGLIKDVARTAVARSVDPAAPDAARQIDAGADAASSGVIGKVVGDGYAVVEQEVLRSTIEIKDGKLVINGKQIEVNKALQSLGSRPQPIKAKDAPAAEHH
jgi:uncharacterized protein YdgA (DUF945 family)